MCTGRDQRRRPRDVWRGTPERPLPKGCHFWQGVGTWKQLGQRTIMDDD
jgi:hypothetical protein